MIQAGLQIAHVALRGNVDEIEHLLHVAIERLLVRHEPLARTPKTRAHPIVAHDLVEHTREPILAQLAKLAHQVVIVAACHNLKLYTATIYRVATGASA